MTLVGGARQELDAVRQHDPALAGLADRLNEASYLLADVAGELASYTDALDADPARLAAVQERRAALARLVRAYGSRAAAETARRPAADPADVADWRTGGPADLTDARARRRAGTGEPARRPGQRRDRRPGHGAGLDQGRRGPAR